MLEIQALTYNDLPPVVPVAGTIPREGGTLGRGRENAVILPDPMRLVSRQHLQFTLGSDNNYQVSNISTANLVYINDYELEPGSGCPVNDQDKIIIGGYVLRVACSVQQTEEAGASLSKQSINAGLPLVKPEDDDFLGSLLGENPVPQTNTPITHHDVDALDPFADSFHSAPIDPMQALNERGVDLGSFDRKGDELINGTDASAMANELLRDPLNVSFEDTAKRNLDPLSMFDNDYAEGIDDILQSGKKKQTSFNTAGMDVNHGSELDGLFRLPEPGNTPVYSDILNTETDVNTTLLDSGDQFIVNFGNPSDENLLKPDIAEIITPSDIPSEIEKPQVNASESHHQNSSELSLSAEMVSDQAISPAPATEGMILPDDLDQFLSELHSDLVSPDVQQESVQDTIVTKPVAKELLVGVNTIVTESSNSLPTQPVAPVTSHPVAAKVSSQNTQQSSIPFQDHDEVAEHAARELYEAFIEGLGIDALPDRNVLDKDFMKLIGQLLRSYAQGTVELIAGRAIVKQAVRANVTLIAPERNNPLKFSPDGEVAVMYLLGRQFPGFMEPVEAVQHAFTDLRAHQIGIVSGMRNALNHVLDRFDPSVIDNEASRAGLIDSMLSVGRKARLWEAYGRYFQTTREGAEDHFQEFFGSAFLEAYEHSISAVHSGENRNKS